VARFEISVSDAEVDTPEAYQTVDVAPPARAYQTVDLAPPARAYQTVDAPPSARAYQTSDQGPAAYRTTDTDAALRAGEAEMQEISPLSG
jgi:hypothetical protein